MLTNFQNSFIARNRMEFGTKHVCIYINFHHTFAVLLHYFVKCKRSNMTRLRREYQKVLPFQFRNVQVEQWLAVRRSGRTCDQ